MLNLRILKKVKKFEELQCCVNISKRFLSTQNLSLNKKNDVSRKYLKPLTNLELKPFEDNYIQNLVAGVINKSIFEYPAVLRESDNDMIINHTADVERFLVQNPNANLSEDVVNELRRLEVFGLTVPQKYGGAGYNETECTFLHECTGLNPTIGRFLGYNENFGCKILSQFGTEEQKEKYLPRLAQGKSFISLAYLENGPLIDLSKIQGYSIHDEIKNRYILTAEKKWVHNADKADLFLIMVKLAEFFDKTAEVAVRFNFFIVEKNTPGITVHKLLAKYAEENNLFDVSFKEVQIPCENLIGNIETDGFLILKRALSHNNITDAALCSNVIKQIIHNIVHFVKERNYNDKSVKGDLLIQENLALLTTYMYALESAMYMVTGRFDSLIDPELFNESVFVKTLAIESLHLAVRKYTEILGRESLKSSGLLQEAIQAVQYYSVFDENIEYLKMFTAADGIVHSSKLLSGRIKRQRKPYESSGEALKLFFSFTDRTQEIRKKQKYKMEVHGSMESTADILEECVAKFQEALEEMFMSHGAKALSNENLVIKFADMAAYIYSLTACIARASSAACYDFPNYKRDKLLALAFGHVVNGKINEICNEELKFSILNNLYEEIGRTTFTQKQYPAEHPLTRTF